LPAKIRNAAQRLRRKYTIEADLTEEEDFDPEDGGQKISTAITQLMAGLEKNEYQLLRLVAMGYLQKEIAEKLGITQQAVSSRIKKLRNSAKTLLD
jgi:DNA-directed RNA polymerase specialized sigma24 family protein